MKTGTISTLCTVLLLANILLISACKKDSDNSGTTTFRIKEYLEYEDGVPEYKTVIDYEGNKVSKIHEYYKESPEDPFVEEYRTEVSYPDNSSAVITQYESDGTNWTPYHKSVVAIDGKIISSCNEYYYIDEGWKESSKFQREIADQKIMNSISHMFNGVEWSPYWKNVYNYDGNHVTSELTYDYYSGDWAPAYKSVISYNGDLFNHITGYYYQSENWMEEYRTVFTYEGGKISKVEDYDFSEGSWVKDDYSTSFTYDSDGNVTSWNEDYSGSSWKLEFSYEKGEGNWPQLLDSEDGDSWLYYKIMPMPTKASPQKMKVWKQLHKRPEIR